MTVTSQPPPPSVADHDVTHLSLLELKVERLLSSLPRGPWAAERTLVALLLLKGLPPEGAAHVLDHTHSWLGDWVSRWLERVAVTSSRRNQPSSNNHKGPLPTKTTTTTATPHTQGDYDHPDELYLRLGAQLLAHVPRTPLARGVLKALDARASRPATPIDVELVASVGLWLEANRTNHANQQELDTITVNHALGCIWKRWSTATEPGALGKEGGAPPNREHGSSSSSSSWHVWYQLLEQLLQQPWVVPASIATRSATATTNATTTTTTTTDHQDLETIWNDTVLGTLRVHLPHIQQHGPTTCFQQILAWWLSPMEPASDSHSMDAHRDSQQRIRVAELLVSCILTVLRQHQPPSSLRPALCRLASADVLRLLESSLVATSRGADGLRVLSWTCLSTILSHEDGWIWLQEATDGEDDRWTRQLPRKSRDADKMPRLCTTLRLASGELRIQLGRRGPASLDIVGATTHIVAQGLNFLARTMDAGQCALSSTAILHIRWTFRESLDTCIQFLTMNDQEQEPSRDVQLMVVQLFTALSAEFLEFPLENREADGEVDNADLGQQPGRIPSHSSLPILPALRKALEFRDVALQGRLLPALTMVLAASEEDDDRIKCLQDAELVGAPLIEFLCAFFGNHDNMDGVDEAAQVVELWFEIAMAASPSTSGDKERLQKSISGWIDAALSQSNHADHDEAALSTALGSAVASYVTLQGDSPPPEPAYSILQRALKYCSLVQMEDGFI